jgi:aarF domain-containing kinase
MRGLRAPAVAPAGASRLCAAPQPRATPLAARRGRAPPLPALARAAGAGSRVPAPSPAAARRRPPADAADAVERVARLVQDLVELALAAGPAGPARALQGAAAVATLTQEVLAETAALGPGAAPPAPPALLRRLFERLGATYIKLAQFIASSPTLFPPEFVTEFDKCLDQATPVPFETLRPVIEAELGQPLSALFESVDPVPLACASIAQVHCAVLRGSRKEVVLKVLKPGVADALSADLSFVTAAAKVLEFLAPDVARGSLAAVVGDLRASMLDELDFRKEAKNVAACASRHRAGAWHVTHVD